MRITPPQQALDWILDLYDHENEVIANGQTIVYTLHESIGHLGIFVSGQVASKQDKELIQFMDMIDLLPPGIYEAVIDEVGDNPENQRLMMGKVDEYRRSAASMLDLAQRTDSLPDKNRLLTMAEAWLDLADRAAKPNAADYSLVRTRLGTEAE